VSDIQALNALAWELDRAIERAPRSGPAPRRPRVTAALVAAALALGGGAALAAGLLPLGSPVRGPHRGEVPPRLSPTPGSAVIAPIRVRDPYRGDAWAVRLAHTASGGVCIAAAQIRGGTLGMPGRDGRFHELPLTGTGTCGDLRTDPVLFDVAVTPDPARPVTVISGTGGPALARVSIAGAGDIPFASGAFLAVLAGDRAPRLRVVAHFKDGTTRTLYEPKGHSK
jgi:hypothetical protein